MALNTKAAQEFRTQLNADDEQDMQLNWDLNAAVKRAVAAILFYEDFEELEAPTDDEIAKYIVEIEGFVQNSRCVSEELYWTVYLSTLKRFV